MSSSSSIRLENFLRLVAFAHHAFGRDAGNAVGPRGVFAELRIGFFVRLRAHDVGDAEPLLALVVHFDRPQHDDITADARRPPAGEINGAVALLGVVDHDEELRLVTGFIAAAPAGHLFLRAAM